MRVALALSCALGSGLPGCGSDKDRTRASPEEAGSGGRGIGARGGVSGDAGRGGASARGGSTAEGGSISLGGTTAGGSGDTSGAAGSGDTCAAETARARVVPVRLAFAFDVSGSMGELDYPWHDPTLKWDPIVAATRAFFEDPASDGIEASLTTFPIGGDDWDAKCTGGSYVTPTVPFTALPSRAFGTALDAARRSGWGEGTPTLAVVNGVLSYVASSVGTDASRHALVLVTDGYPQGCSDNSIASIVEAVSAVAPEVPTYVIGVANPPLVDADGNRAPETVMNLTDIAAAGGTEQAYVIDTGDPSATKAAFSAAIDEIRGATIACSFDIPASPDGRTFERDKVAVTATSGGAKRELSYDSSCAEPDSWHYDDPSDPTRIELCDETCNDVQGDRSAAIDVTFTCDSVIDPH